MRGPVQSPTFVLARTHPSLVGGAPLVHVDAYRLGDAAELDDLDLDFAGSVVVVEWGAGLLDGVERLLARDRHRASHGRERRPPTRGSRATTSLDADEPRTLTVLGYGPRWAGGPYAA